MSEPSENPSQFADTSATSPDTQTADPGTLALTGNGAAALLGLQPAQMPLTRQAPAGSRTRSVLDPPPSAVGDNDDVEDPTVVKVGAKYVMWYTGRAEDGGPPALFRLESDKANDWPVTPATTPVLRGTAGAFDEHGVYGADVVYDATDSQAPYKMYYSGIGPVFTAIGFATSTDGIAWTKYDPDADGKPDPIVRPGLPGSRDAFAVAHPTVLRDASLWKMWYEADDSTLKAIGYATSVDGLVWQKAGAVIQQDPLDTGGNTAFGVFAPTVFKDGTGFAMVLGGRKEIGSTKLINASSPDGIAWTLGSIALNPQTSSFDASNLNAPEVVEETVGGGTRYRLYYAGDRTGQDGDERSRIGLSEPSSGTGWQGGKYSGNRAFGSIVDVGAPGTAFDARAVRGPSVADPGATNDWVGAYSGIRSVPDRLSRIGIATTPDGVAWTRRREPGTGGSIIALAGADAGGQSDPSLSYRQGAGNVDDWYLYYTGTSSAAAKSVVLASTDEDSAHVTLQRRSGTKWVKVVRVRTTSRSTFAITRRLTKGRHQFRVTTGADKDHLAGRSPVKRVRIS